MKAVGFRFTMAAVVTAGLASAGCGHGGVARDEAGYRDATREVVTARNDQIRSCYDAALKQQSSLAGRVTVKFKVQAETGKVVEPMVDPAGTTAPESLSRCVVQAVDGATLSPPDQREAHAAFSWEFQPGA